MGKRGVEEEGWMKMGGWNVGEMREEEVGLKKLCASVGGGYCCGMLVEVVGGEVILKGIRDEGEWNEKMKGLVKLELSCERLMGEEEEKEML